ncbi:MAG: helix-turn-helix domain-containing protein [Caenispirillum sp.]|nr:helix-turn-helix domain-containing protein [Caenispirillum sp.]
MKHYPAQRSSTAPDWRPPYLAVLADLRRARAASGLTQAEVAVRLGIHMRTLRRWENGEGDPPAGMLFRWAAVVGVMVTVNHGANLPHGEPDKPIVLRNTMPPSLSRLVGGS